MEGIYSNINYPYSGLMGAATTGLPARLSGRQAGQAGVQPLKYGGKELDRQNGLDLLDFGARHYDMMLPMFTTFDPLGEKDPGRTPYGYCAGNPLRYIDPTGMFLMENIESSTNYGIIAIYQSNYYDYKINYVEKDYSAQSIDISIQAARKSGIPLIFVDDIADFSNAMSELSRQDITTQAYSITSHGSPAKFHIGNDDVELATDVTSLQEGLSNKSVLINACSVAATATAKFPMDFLEVLSTTLNAVIYATPDEILADHGYDNRPINTQPSNAPFYFTNVFYRFEKGKDPTTIYNLRFDLQKNFIWDK